MELITFPPITTKHVDDAEPVTTTGLGGQALALEMHTGKPLALAPRDADGDPVLALHEVAYMGWWARRQTGEDLPEWSQWWPGVEGVAVETPTRRARRPSAKQTTKKAAKPTT